MTVKPQVLGCLVKTRNRLKTPAAKTTDIGERVHPPRKVRRGKEKLLTNCHLIYQELPLDIRLISRLVLRMVCQSSTMCVHSSSTERI